MAAGKSTIDQAYQIEEICQNLDLIHIMSYDLHGLVHFFQIFAFLNFQ